MKTRLLVLAFVLLLTISPIIPYARAEKAVLYPTDDASVNSAWPNQVYNWCPLAVRDEPYIHGLVGRVYLRFDLTGIDYSRICTASLNLYCYDGFPYEPLLIDACKVADDSWKELSLTWNNAPSIGDVITTLAVSYSSEGWLATWNGDAMTNYIRAECASDGIASIALKFSEEHCTLCCSRSRDFYSTEWYYKHPYLELNLRPSIESCDSGGIRKDFFYTNESVYATGTGYSPSKSYELYIVNDVGTWTDGMSIPASVVSTKVSSDSSGKIVPTIVWQEPLTAGKYDIIVDVNGNGVYDACIDAIDDNDIEVTSGFVVVKPKHQLTIEVEGSGATDPVPGDYMYDEGTEVSVIAAPSADWKFDHWLLDGVDVGSANPFEVTMNTDHVLRAVFVEIPQYTLAISVIGSGTTDPAIGNHIYAENTVVSVQAFAEAGWVFDHWLLDSVDVGSANPYEVTMDSNHVLIAVFVELPPPQYELIIQVSGSGSTDPAAGSHVYDEGSVVYVTAFPSSCWMLDHWLLDSVDVGSANPYQVTMDKNHVLTAVFVERVPPTVESCDVAGVRKDIFSLNEIVYANGTGYSPLTTFDLYVVGDVVTWSDGMPIPAYIAKVQVTSDSFGRILPTVAWNPILTPGKYDVIVDVDGNGRYDVCIDALDDKDVEVTAGFLVIPEFPFGALLGMFACFAALGMYRTSKRKFALKHRI